MRIAKERASSLDLATGHITGRRQWTDDDLRSAAIRCCTWQDLQEELGYTGSAGNAKETILTHAVRIGLDLSHLDPLKPKARSENAPREYARTWTDEQLRQAVEDSNSWRAVQRALGLHEGSSASRRTLQKHATRLELDTSHFTGGRRWTQQQLIRASRAASTWQELGDLLGVTTESGMRTFIKGHAARIGLDLSHLSRPRPKINHQESSLTGLAYQPEHLRRVAPHIAMTWFMARGCTPSLPTEPEPYDLIVNTPAGLQRVQVKSTTCKSNGHWQVGVGHGSGGPRPQDRVMPYDHEEIELFFIVDGDLNMYLIPSLVLAGRVSVAVDIYREYCVGNAAATMGLAPPMQTDN
ncbi:MAG: hypothetical protein JWN00_1934 [Actinomycetia bacterium]|nr:hypothetical protein [Actinomycetes bacterium]